LVDDRTVNPTLWNYPQEPIDEVLGDG